MFFNLVVIAIVVFFSAQLKLIWAVRNFDLNITPDEDDTTNQRNNNNNLTIQSNCSSSEKSAANKRLRTALSSSNISKKKQLKYSVNTHPINPVTDEKIANSLRYWEVKLFLKGKNCVWENFPCFTKEQAKELCIQIWNMEVREIPEIKVTEGMINDCDINLVSGPSTPEKMFRHYKGIYQYMDKCKEFFPDLVRCNCAVLQNTYGIVRTAGNSKRFFFLYKHTEKVYYVLTIHGETVNRELKIVNVRKIH